MKIKYAYVIIRIKYSLRRGIYVDSIEIFGYCLTHLFYRYFIESTFSKGAIKVDDILRTGKSYGRTYKPTLSKEEYEIMQLEKSFDEVKPSKLALTNFLPGLIESENIEEDDTLEELENLIKKHKKD